MMTTHLLDSDFCACHLLQFLLSRWKLYACELRKLYLTAFDQSKLKMKQFVAHVRQLTPFIAADTQDCYSKELSMSYKQERNII